mgnify:CR=1 FL=1
MFELLIGTTNRGKLAEYEALLKSLPVRLRSVRDVGLDTLDVEENADTYEENAVHKARVYAQASGLYALADDTGLIIDALDGRPGIYSHRYAGPDADDRARYEKVLAEMDGVPDAQRTARFVCVVALVNPQTLESVTTTGTVEGRIARTPDLSGGGFGYDAVFLPNGYSTALSALSMDEKNQISHRGNALRQMLPILERLIEEQ